MPKPRVERRERNLVRESSFANFEGRHFFASVLPPTDPVTSHNDAIERKRLTDYLAEERESRKRKRVETSVPTAAGDAELTPVTTSPAQIRATDMGNMSMVSLPVDSGAAADTEDEHAQLGTAPLMTEVNLPDLTGEIFPFEEEGEKDRNSMAPVGAAENMPPNLTVIEKRLRTVLSWDKLLAYLCITGPTRFTASQYLFFASAIQAANDNVRLRTYKTVRGKMSSQMLNYCFPRSAVLHVRDIPQLPGHGFSSAMVATDNAGLKRALDCVRVVLPSEWAKIDVAMLPFYKEVFENPRLKDKSFLTIENTRVVRMRSTVVGVKHVMWASFNDAVCVAAFGDRVSIPCADLPKGRNVGEEGWLVNIESVCAKSRTTEKVSVVGLVGGMWCVAFDGHEDNPSSEPDSSWTAEERVLFNALLKSSPTGVDATVPSTSLLGRRNRRAPIRRSARGRIRQAHVPEIIPSDSNGHRVQVYPGDICVVIRPASDAPNSTSVCVLIASFLAYAQGLPAERLVWIDKPSLAEDPCTMRIVAMSTVTGLPRWIAGRCSSPIEESSDPANKGFLENGERYVVYRVALYADGFKQYKSLSDKRSVGGCYLMLLGLPVESRRSTAAARVLTLASHSQTLNEVMNLVLDDIAEAASHGVQGVDPYGRKVRIFVDPVSFFGDYPAASAAADVMGHTANAFCTHCTIARRRSTSLAEIVYTSDVHSRRLGYMRFDERMKAIRSAEISSSMRRVLGMKAVGATFAEKLPCVALGMRLPRGVDIPKTDMGNPVLDPAFDSSLSAAAVPDHLLTGLTKNVLLLCFGELKTDEERAKVELQIVCCAAGNGLPIQGGISRWERSGQWNGLVSLTMSTLFCILLCAASVFEMIHAKTNDSVFLLPRRLQDLVAKTYYWPCRTVDGNQKYAEIGGNARVQYYGDLMRVCQQFVQAAAAVIVAKGEQAKVIDKPNAHRAVELCAHTIPMFGHAKNCSEMVLELYHRVFKEWLEKNANPGAHLTAVEQALARDWLGRLYSLYVCWSRGEGRDRSCAELGLRRLLLGEEGLSIDDTTRPGLKFLDLFRSALRESFREPVLGQLRDCGQVSQSLGRTYKWEAMNKVRQQREEHETAVKGVLRQLKEHYRMERGKEDFELCEFRRARYVSIAKYDDRRRAYPYNIVAEGSAVSAVVRERSEVDIVLYPREDGEGILRLYAIFAVVKGEDSVVWGVVRELKEEGREYRVGGQEMQVMRFCSSVRRVGIVHVCDAECDISRAEKTVRHSAAIHNGGLYKVLTRDCGFPPHMG